MSYYDYRGGTPWDNQPDPEEWREKTARHYNIDEDDVTEEQMVEFSEYTADLERYLLEEHYDRERQLRREGL